MLTPDQTSFESIKRATEDPQYFAETFCHTIRDAVPTLFPSYDYFAETWDAFRKRESMQILKSRQLTFSWLMACGFLWDVWTPGHRDFGALMMSRAQGLVDDGGENSTPDSLLGKIRYIYSHLPEAVKWNIDFTYNRITNPATGSYIKGTTSNSEAGRSGNYMRALQDEDAFIPNSENVYAAIKPGIPRGLIKLSTPNGKNNNFYRFWISDNSPFRQIRASWSDHPDRGCDHPAGEDHVTCWYAREKEELGSALRVARELDHSFEGSTGGKVYFEFDNRFIRDAPAVAGLPILRGWDFGVGDQTAIIEAQIIQAHSITGRAVPCIRIFGAYRNSQEGFRHYRKVMGMKQKKYPLTCSIRDVGDPHNLKSRDSSLGSWQKNLKDPDYPEPPISVKESKCRGVPYNLVLDNSQKFMSMVTVEDGSKVPRLLVDRKLKALIGCFEGWRRRVDEDGNPLGDGKPLHDEMSHWMDAYRYLCWTVEPMRGGPSKLAKKDAPTVGVTGSAEIGRNW